MNGKKTEPDRICFSLTATQTRRFNAYIVKVGNKLGRIPASIRTKIMRKALDEWLQNHENDVNIDWDKEDDE